MICLQYLVEEKKIDDAVFLLCLRGWQRLGEQKQNTAPELACLALLFVLATFVIHSRVVRAKLSDRCHQILAI